MEEDLLRPLQLTVSSDKEKDVVSSDSDTRTDSDTSPPQDPRAHAGKDDATAELVQKLAEEDLLRKESPVKSPTKKSPTKKLTSALKNLESGYIEVDPGKRKRNQTGYLLPSAKRVLVLKTDKSKTQKSSRTSQKLKKKKPLKETPPPLHDRLQAIVNGKDITVFVEMLDKPRKLMNDY
eukprot:8022269-Heterocapsa_arctica.AAC.1